MSESQDPVASSSNRRPCCGGKATFIWIAVIGLLVLIQWPMIKGWFYGITGSAPPDAIGWRGDFAAALEESARTGRPVLIDFTASWCPPCRVMKHDVWPDAEVAKLANEKYVPIFVDVDNSTMASVVRRYAISGIPAILVVNKDGEITARGAYMSKGEMIDFLKRNG